MSDVKIIVAAQVEQEFEAVSAVAALKDNGIAASYKPTAADSLLGLPGAMGCPDSFDILVPEQAAAQAKDILVAVGCLDESQTADEEEITDNEEAAGKESNAEDTEAAAPQTLNDLMPENPVLAAVYKVLLAVFALVFIGGFVWLCDTVIAWVMNLFR